MNEWNIKVWIFELRNPAFEKINSKLKCFPSRTAVLILMKLPYVYVGIMCNPKFTLRNFDKISLVDFELQKDNWKRNKG